MICELSDLPVDQCACRVHKPEADRGGQQAKPRRWFGLPFPARFAGKCDGCGDPYEDGELIRDNAGGGFVHDGCAAA